MNLAGRADFGYPAAEDKNRSGVVEKSIFSQWLKVNGAGTNARMLLRRAARSSFLGMGTAM